MPVVHSFRFVHSKRALGGSAGVAETNPRGSFEWEKQFVARRDLDSALGYWTDHHLPYPMHEASDIRLVVSMIGKNGVRALDHAKGLCWRDKGRVWTAESKV